MSLKLLSTSKNNVRRPVFIPVETCVQDDCETQKIYTIDFHPEIAMDEKNKIVECIKHLFQDIIWCMDSLYTSSLNDIKNLFKPIPVE